jgi:hypothetical protein
MSFAYSTIPIPLSIKIDLIQPYHHWPPWAVPPEFTTIGLTRSQKKSAETVKTEIIAISKMGLFFSFFLPPVPNEKAKSPLKATRLLFKT